MTNDLNAGGEADVFDSIVRKSLESGVSDKSPYELIDGLERDRKLAEGFAKWMRPFLEDD